MVKKNKKKHLRIYIQNTVRLVLLSVVQRLVSNENQDGDDLIYCSLNQTDVEADNQASGQLNSVYTPAPQVTITKNLLGLVMFVWQLDIQLPVQSVPITTNVVSSNPIHGGVYSIQHCDRSMVFSCSQPEMMGTLLICISKMATPGHLQFSYDLYRRYHS